MDVYGALFPEWFGLWRRASEDPPLNISSETLLHWAFRCRRCLEMLAENAEKIDDYACFTNRSASACDFVSVVFGASVAFSITQWNRLPFFAVCHRNAFSTHSGADRRCLGCMSTRMSLSTLTLVIRAHALAGGCVRGRLSMATRLGDTDRGRKDGDLWLLRLAALRR